MQLLLASCDDYDKETEQEVKPPYGTSGGRVVLFYMAMENTLSSYASGDLQEILAGAKYLGERDHALVFIDDTSKPRLYDITFQQRDTKMSELQPVVSYEEDLNSCSPEVFGDVLQYVKLHYPASSYGLVMESHASGWVPPLPATSSDNSNAWGAKSRAFGYDNDLNIQNNAGSQLTIDDIRDQLLQFGRFDFILFDACFMQNIEVAYQLRNCAGYIIGSPAEIPAYGAPYDTMLKPMFSDTAYVEGMVQAYYDYYYDDVLYGILLSAVDCSRLEEVASVTSPYVKAYKQKLLTMSYQQVLDYMWWDKYYMQNYPDYYDMQGLMRTALSEADYEAWYETFRRLFVCQRHTDRWYSVFNQSANNKVDSLQYSGISMHVPLQKYANRNKWFASAYYETDWAKAVWNEPEDTDETNNNIE